MYSYHVENLDYALGDLQRLRSTLEEAEDAGADPESWIYFNLAIDALGAASRYMALARMKQVAAIARRP